MTCVFACYAYANMLYIFFLSIILVHLINLFITIISVISIVVSLLFRFQNMFVMIKQHGVQKPLKVARSHSFTCFEWAIAITWHSHGMYEFFFFISYNLLVFEKNLTHLCTENLDYAWVCKVEMHMNNHK